MQVLPVSVTLAFGPQNGVLGRGPDRWSDWTRRIPAATPYPVAPLPKPGHGWACMFHGLLDDQQEAMASLSQQAKTENAGTTSLGALLRAKLDNN